MTSVKIRLDEAAKEIGCKVDHMLAWAEEDEITLFAMIDSYTAHIRDLHGQPPPLVDRAGRPAMIPGKFTHEGTSYTTLLSNEVRTLRGRGALSIRILRPEGEENGIPHYANDGGRFHFWLDDEQTIDVSRLYINRSIWMSWFSCDFAEVNYNGEPINWLYWRDQLKITPEQGAKLAHCIDPLDWPSNEYAQGEIPNELLKKISKLANELSGKADSFTFNSLRLTLRRSRTPYSMRPVWSDTETAKHEQIGGIANKSPAPAKAKNIWNDHNLRNLIEDSREPGMTLEKLGKKYGISRPGITKQLEKAKDKFAPKKANAFDQWGAKRKK